MKTGGSLSDQSEGYVRYRITSRALLSITLISIMKKINSCFSETNEVKNLIMHQTNELKIICY